jgi:hypothetical protein
MSMYGGGFATVPAYLRDMFGTAQVGAIHGRLLTAWSAAGVAGPVLVNYIREYQVNHGVAKADAYTTTMYLMAGLLLVGLVCNLLVRPLGGEYPEATKPLAEAPAHLDRRSRVSDQIETQSPEGTAGRPWLLILSWLWVGVPLAWGVLETVRTSLGLFR